MSLTNGISCWTNDPIFVNVYLRQQDGHYRRVASITLILHTYTILTGQCIIHTMADLDANSDAEYFHDPEFIATSGGWVHKNNVHWLFRRSPFFDRTCVNNDLYVQNEFDPDGGRVLGSLDAFENAVSKIKGRQYVVAVDPLSNFTMQTDHDGAPKQNMLWVIRYQDRYGYGLDDYTPLDYFYITQSGVVFKAPRLDRLIGNRILQAQLALDKVFVAASELPVFSAANGHTYFVPEQKKTPVPDSVVSARAESPIPDAQSINKELSEEEVKSDQRNLMAALRMTLSLGGKYADDMPLVGEPGSWRFAATKDSAQVPRVTAGRVPGSPTASSRLGTPAPSTNLVSSK